MPAVAIATVVYVEALLSLQAPGECAKPVLDGVVLRTVSRLASATSPRYESVSRSVWPISLWSGSPHVGVMRCLGSLFSALEITHVPHIG